MSNKSSQNQNLNSNDDFWNSLSSSEDDNFWSDSKDIFGDTSNNDDIFGTPGSYKDDKSSNKKGKKVYEYALKRPSWKKIVGTVIVAFLFVCIIFGITFLTYRRYVRYPDAETIDETKTGMYALNNYENVVHKLGAVDSSNPNDKSYLPQEITYANGDKEIENFMKNMVSTISYAPKKIYQKNIYGNDYIDIKTDKKVEITSPVVAGEEVKFTYVDYENVPLDLAVIQKLMEESDVKLGDVDYNHRIIDVFCKYINQLANSGKLQTKTVDRVPNLIDLGGGYQGSGYAVTSDEDTYIDRLLFSSKEFRNLENRFSRMAGTATNYSDAWQEWYKLDDANKARVEEPSTDSKGIIPLGDSYKEYLRLDEDAKKATVKPPMYGTKNTMVWTWCGVYYMQNEYKEVDNDGNVVKRKLSAQIGNGTKEDPAGLDTPVLTSIFVEQLDENGVPYTVQYPIMVELVDYGVSQDAIDYFESKDPQNRGYDIDSELQYAHYSFKVTNMSDKTLLIPDNSMLCDSQAQYMKSPGKIFGLTESVTLKPDESGIIESFGSSTELNKRYLVWGKDFDRRADVVWFRVLNGNPEDTSNDKGVHINKSRYGEDSEIYSNDDDETSTSSSEDTKSKENEEVKSESVGSTSSN